MAEAPSTTWLLVRISPSAVSTTPVPAPTPPFMRLSMSTTPTSTLAATSSQLESWAVEPVPLDESELPVEPWSGTVAVEPPAPVDPDGAGVVVTGGAVAVLEELVSTAREATPPAVAPRSRATTRATSIPMREPDLVQELRRGAGLPGAAPYGVAGGTGGGDIGGPACWACHTGGVAGWGCHIAALVGGAGGA